MFQYGDSPAWHFQQWHGKVANVAVSCGRYEGWKGILCSLAQVCGGIPRLPHVWRDGGSVVPR